MCGICGIHGPGASLDPIATMLDQMQHRGPDGTGQWAAPGIALGHRRLSIVDLSERGRQPMFSSEGNVVISVNGEIYNYHELRAELEALGCIFKSDCDSETVIHGWEMWGEASFSRYNGMFAIALWDLRSQALYLVRDRMGIKPIYYWEHSGTTLFASDLRAIVAASGRAEWKMSRTGLAQYLKFENRFGKTTMLEGVSMVEPGHVLKVDANGIQDRVYSHALACEPRETDFSTALGEFPLKFGQAIDRHLMSDVPLASYLSSGIDSGMVTLYCARRLAAGQANKGPAAFTGTFDAGGWYDEVSGAALVAGSADLPHTRVTIGADAFRNYFDELVFALEEPRMGTGALPQYLVARKVAETHKVVLTGHGGDELFAGYPVFKFVALIEALKQGNGRVLLRLVRSLRISELPHIAYFALRSLIGGSERPFLPRLFGQTMLRRLLKAPTFDAVRREEGRNTVSKESGLAELMRQYVQDYLPGLLVVEDKVSMAHSLESRTPFLDNELVDWALSLPLSSKLEGGRLKAIPKAAARGLLPDALFSMPKRGFPNPLSHWLRGDLAPWAAERLFGPESELGLIFETSRIERFWKSYERSWFRRLRPLDEINTHRIWMLLCLESWIRQYRTHLGVRLVAPCGEERR